MADFKENGFMYLIGALVVAFVISESLFFLIRAWKEGKRLGISAKTMKATVTQSALFSIAPSISIVATVLTLSGALGLVLPWIRLSVIGNITYEVPAAEAALEALGITGGMAGTVSDPKVFATVAWVMTLGSIMPLVIVPFALKKIQKGIGKAVGKKDAKWADAMSAAAFIGLISAFVGRAIVGQGDKAVLGDGAGILSVTALLSAIGFMFLLSWLQKKTRWKWLESMGMPLAMFLSLGVIMLLSAVLPADFAQLEWRG